MSSYLIGNLVGRLLMSAFLVWLVLLCINRFKPAYSAKRLLRPLPLLAAVIVFIAGLIGHVVSDTGVQQLTNPADTQNSSVFPEVGDRIHKPAQLLALETTTGGQRAA